jgi:hypothetical protein
MLAKSSDSLAADLKSIKSAAISTEIRWPARVLLLALNFLPLLMILISTGMLFMPLGHWLGRCGISLAILYLMPPILARLVLAFATFSEGTIAIGSTNFFCWWASFQLQIIFCRFPALEEALRLIPGLYSLWLRLWGSKIGRLTYWSPGVAITDRSFLSIGNDVVFGAGVRLNAHVLARSKEGVMQLILAPVKIGDHVMVGGYSLLTAGTEISPDEATRAHLLSPPFSIWKDGKRIKQSGDFE